MPRTLVVTNDFPPRLGGIQTYVHELARRLPPGQLVVYASDHPGAAAFDASCLFPVVRDRARMLLPTARVVARAADLLRAESCASVWFGAAAPLALMGPGLRRAGAERLIASTHGHETGWAAVPGARALLRRISTGVDAVTHITDWTRRRLTPVMDPATPLVHLPPGVDVALFSPAADGTALRRRLGLAEAPTVVCVSRLVRRKGQDVLIRALPPLGSYVPDVRLLLVGGGPDRQRLERLAASHGVADTVVFAGEVPWARLPAYYAAGDAFAMPCRTRRGGLDVEGLGMVFLEASAVGLPVLAGNSGGAPEAVRDGVTGMVVHDPRSPAAVATRLAPLLTDAALAAQMGKAGRDWVAASWTWDLLAKRLAGLLDLAQPLPAAVRP